MINFFLFGGVKSTDYGIYISGSNTFNAPERDVENIEIPGRNGNLTISRHRFKNISISYPAFIRHRFRENTESARKWLLGCDGYQRLEDSYHPDYYRMAQFIGPMDFDMRFLNQSGEFNLSFDCKPQRWRKDGETPLLLPASQTIYNELFPALPLIKINGTGTGNLYVGGYTVEILSLDEYVMLDSDTQNAYKGTLNKNSTISAPEFPVLQSGDNVVDWDGNITSIEITPRWWTV